LQGAREHVGEYFVIVREQQAQRIVLWVLHDSPVCEISNAPCVVPVCAQSGTITCARAPPPDRLESLRLPPNLCIAVFASRSPIPVPFSPLVVRRRCPVSALAIPLCRPGPRSWIRIRKYCGLQLQFISTSLSGAESAALSSRLRIA